MTTLGDVWFRYEAGRNETSPEMNITTETVFQISTAEKVFELIVLLSIDLLAFTGNTCLWTVIVRTRQLHSSTNCLVLCLSSADLLISVVNIPSVCYLIVAGNGSLPATGCVVLGFVNMVTFIVSVMSLGLISVNRYVLICHPHRFQQVYSKLNLGLMISGEFS